MDVWIRKEKEGNRNCKEFGNEIGKYQLLSEEEMELYLKWIEFEFEGKLNCKEKFIPRSEFLFTLQGSIFIPLFGDYIKNTML